MKKLLMITIVLSLFLSSCSNYQPEQANARVEGYLAQLKSLPVTASHPHAEQQFLTMFGDFKQAASKADIIRNVYADSFYFNDTFKTFNSLDDLVEYMQKTAEQVTVTRVALLDVAKSDSDYYLRWVMDMVFMAKGREVKSKSIGMTQLRFDQEGKIILHQDFWDGGEGFYQHLPFVDYIVNKIQSGL